MNRRMRRAQKRAERIAGAVLAERAAPTPWTVRGSPRQSFIDGARRISDRALDIGSDDFVLLAEEIDLTGADDAPPADPVTEPQRPARKLVSARGGIVGAAIEAATTSAQRRSWNAPKRQMAVVIVVPTAAWVAPVESYFTALEGNWVTFARSGKIRSRDTADVGNDEVSVRLARGRHVVGISNDIHMLPASLISAADMIVRITPPDGSVLRAAMKRCLRGRTPRKVDDAIVAGLDLDDLVSAFRPSSSSVQVIERLRVAASSRRGFSTSEDIPDLETAIEYGEAREWGLSLARDIAEYRLQKLTWAEIDKGAILFSEPGFGKTLFAKALAAKCKIPLIVFSVGELFASSNPHLDGIIKRQREFFAMASAAAASASTSGSPGCALLFCDEYDALPSRNSLSGSHNSDWWLPVISDQLCLLDGALNNGAAGASGASRANVIVLAATNRIHAIDPAFLRPGRLERAIEIKRPDAAGVLNILRFHLKRDLKDIDLTGISHMLEGSTPAEIMEAVRAARRSARQAQRDLTAEDLRGRITGGENESPEYLRRIAVHEAAHAVAAVVLGVGALKRVQLRSQGNAGGHTLIRHADDDDLATLADVENQVTSILAAAVAERLVIGAVSTGSGGDDRSDLAVATAMLAVVHTATAVTGNLFHRCSAEDALATARADPHLRRVVGQHLRALEVRAEALVTEHRNTIVAVADELARRRHLSGDDVRAIIKRVHPGTTSQP